MEYVSNNVISINRPILKKLEAVLDHMKAAKLCKEETFNALFIDSKGFIRTGTVTVGRMEFEFAYFQPMRVSMNSVTDMAAKVNKARFQFYELVDNKIAIFKEVEP
jgi:hypothetical protein